MKSNFTLTKREEEKEFKKSDQLSKVNEEEEDEDDCYKYFDYDNEDLNKLDNIQLKQHKDRMEKDYLKNAILPNNENFIYNKEVIFIIK